MKVFPFLVLAALSIATVAAQTTTGTAPNDSTMMSGTPATTSSNGGDPAVVSADPAPGSSPTAEDPASSSAADPADPSAAEPADANAVGAADSDADPSSTMSLSDMASREMEDPMESLMNSDEPVMKPSADMGSSTDTMMDDMSDSASGSNGASHATSAMGAATTAALAIGTYFL